MLILCFRIPSRYAGQTFMLSRAHTWIQAVRPKFKMSKTIEEAAVAVDEMLTAVFQNVDCKCFPMHAYNHQYQNPS